MLEKSTMLIKSTLNDKIKKLLFENVIYVFIFKIIIIFANKLKNKEFY